MVGGMLKISHDPAEAMDTFRKNRPEGDFEGIVSIRIIQGRTGGGAAKRKRFSHFSSMAMRVSLRALIS